MQEEKEVLVSLSSISKSYNDEVILNSVSFDIYDGEFLTLLGASGSGKSTLIKIIAGFEDISAGKIEFVKDPNTSVKDMSNTVFQNYALFPHLNVYENIAFGLKIKKLPKEEIKKRVEDCIKLVQLEKLENRDVSALSGGQQQRVAIARAIVNYPKILLLDESLSALDYKLRKKMQLELKQLQRKLDITFVFVTHDREEALSMSDRIVLIDNGEVVQIGSPKELYEHPNSLFSAKFIGDIVTFEGKAKKKIVDGKEEIHSVVEDHEIRIKTNLKLDDDEEILICVRPEDIKAERELSDVERKFYFMGKVIDVIYKGITIDLLVELDSGKEILIREFYNEDSDALEYEAGDKIYLYWFEGWEVVLKKEDNLEHL